MKMANMRANQDLGNTRDFGEHATKGGNKRDFGKYATKGGKKRDFGEHATNKWDATFRVRNKRQRKVWQPTRAALASNAN